MPCYTTGGKGDFFFFTFTFHLPFSLPIFHFHFPNIQQEAEVIFSSMEMFRNIKCPIMSVQYSEAWLRNVQENPQCSMLHGNYWAKLGILNVKENVQSSMLQGNGWEGSWHRRKKTRWDGWKALGLQERGQVLINQNQNPDKSITHNDNMTWGGNYHYLQCMVIRPLLMEEQHNQLKKVDLACLVVWLPMGGD